MLISLNLKTPNNTGAPDYNICGQAASILNFTNTACHIQVSGVTIFNVADLSSIFIVPSGPIGTTGLSISSFTKNIGTGTLTLGIDGLNVWEEADYTVRLSKTGYRGYENTFKMFGYDLGTGLTTGNPLFNIYLVADANNLDIDGYQSKAFSNCISYRKPFTNKVYIYNMVGTSGTISYNNISTGENLGGGQSCIVCSIIGINIKQTISVSNKYCVITDICNSSISDVPSIWYPSVNKSVYSQLGCNGECTSNMDQQSIELNFQYSDVTIYYINGNPEWIFSPSTPPSLYQQVIFEVYDYNGALINTQTFDTTLLYSNYISNPSSIIPTVFNFLMTTFGDVVVKIKYQIIILTIDSPDEEDTVIVECIKTQIYDSCNFWKVENGEICGQFIINNCSMKELNVVISQMQDDKSFITLSNEELNELSSITIGLDSDGVYQFSVEYIDSEGNNKTEIYLITNYCTFKECYFIYLKKVMCGDICEKCNKTNFYDFNSFMLNAQVFLALLNNEYAFNYFYTAINTNKIEELYTIKQFADRLNEYCSNTCKCSTC